uniref:F-box domain-containing protein n=1 Tax=Brassica campestris TaxID=3711 RepID=M4E5R9_BRACM
MFSSLPDEIIENILARISRWNYPSLSLVSKRFHSLLSSMDIYKARSQRGSNETCLYIWLKLPGHPCASWFSLRPKPNNQKRTKRRGMIRLKRDSSGFSVVPIPFSSTDSFPELHNITTVGSDIYIIGGPYKEPSSSVRIFDCRSHTWRDAPNMTVAREDAQTVLLDEKIYVMGGCDIDKYNANWIEVFDVN